MWIRNISIAIIAVFFAACSGSDDSGMGPGGSADDFDRQAMLAHMADNIIIPVYADLDAKLDGLVAAKNAFVSQPDQTNLLALRTAWLEAYKTWQYAEMFNIGKAEEIDYNFQMNVYPTSVTDVENNIAAGSYDLSHVNNNDAVGFPALDYLLYGVGETDTDILAVYNGENGAAYLQYLSDVSDRMKALTSEVLTDWQSLYRDSFVKNTGTSATGSVSKITNDYIYYYEKGLRANKIGIPAGVFSAEPLPDRVEAYYNGEVSRELAMTALDAVKDFFNGVSYNSNPSTNGFADYLNYLNELNAGEDLNALINAQFNTAGDAISGLNPSFSQQIATDNTMMTQAYDELQKAVVLLKVDMVQAFNVSIDYVDADGD
ncbi:imelysin family protein [Robertkochia aurantiaca]|uniref:imelysin family protein n=1 Tax=Robertkochia aurantiaca TaxID=2873700 RepID=UPI001CC9910E|nr:imelysin family protein [Robertkochia sp. 3YJGBD-33]